MDSHRSNIRPQETDIIIIDHRLYKAAAKGETSAFEQYKDRLHRLLTRDIDPETKSAKFLKQILEMCPTLLTQQNHIGENPLHVAAKYGDIFAVKLLIDQCAKSNTGSSVDHHVDSESGFCGVSKQMLLRLKTQAGDTALHESILMGLKFNEYTDQWWKHCELAEILCKEDHSEVMYDRNAAGETPLYLAVKAGFFSVVKNGLQNIDAQTTSTYYGGYDGKTILHEAVISDFLGIYIYIYIYLRLFIHMFKI
ncbi:hypothetical protein FEM48_Zijuj07G0014100 [Ziziphus jujuba var. spinosa]|uniref:Uncharacterized protein n=1 Tax=Ziziphus jujuba var. spinosa TaxID=714518 RepID=A0A978V1M6_ZIZJJ|nr:hypothetical protein FEM48_Zijuj07G0014100 [Ziziphus jujuba var. spinosa]